MAKKGKVAGGAKASMPPVPQKELYQRFNFAVQASTFIHTLAGPSSSSGSEKATSRDDDHPSSDTKGKRKAQAPGDADLRGLAMGTMISTKKMGAHTQLKLDPSLKRSICSRCSTIIIPGLTARIRTRPDKRAIHISHTTCLQCTVLSSIPTPPTHVIPGQLELDGTSRRRRRERIVKRRKVAFHERERVEGDTEPVEPGGPGHTLWQDGERVEGWGNIPPDTNEGEELQEAET